MILVSVANHSTTLTSSEVDNICRSLSVQATHHIAPAWRLSGASVQQRVRYATDWQLEFYDHSDQAGALGYHDDTDGTPVMKVFVADCMKYGVKPSACASHELAEAMVDPDIIRIESARPGEAWAAEVGDPAQAFTYEVGGVTLQDFVTPAWFGAPGGGKCSYLGKVTAPFSVPAGGYAQYTTDLRNWHQVGAELGAGHTRPALRRDKQGG